MHEDRIDRSPHEEKGLIHDGLQAAVQGAGLTGGGLVAKATYDKVTSVFHKPKPNES